MSKASIELEGLGPHNLAAQISDWFSQWSIGKNVWAKRVAEVIQYVYATSTRETTNVKNPWSHSTVIPKITQIHDNLGANYANALFGNREFFSFEPAVRDEATFEKRKAITTYLATKHDHNSFRDVMKRLLDDWVQTGNCFARVEYVVEKEVDPVTGLDQVVYQGPKVFRISPYDIVFDHTVAEFKDSPKIFRQLLSRGELVRMMEGPEGASYDASEVERLKKFHSVIATWKDNDINKHIQLQMDGFNQPSEYFKSGKVELLHFIGDIYDSLTGELQKSRIITVADRRCLVRNASLNDFQGFGRIYHSGWRRRTDNLWAMGPLENLVGMQYLINHLENARADGFDQILSPDRVFRGNVEVEKAGPVTNYHIDDGNGGVDNLAPDTTVLNADNQIALKEAQMEAYAGAPREAMGIRTPGEKTAFEIQSLQNAAGRLFQTKIEDFEREIVEPILNGEVEVAVRNLDGSDIAQVLDQDLGATEFINITKADLTAKGKIKARGASHFAKRAQMVQELQAFSNILAQDQELRLHYPSKARAKLWAEALGFDKLGIYRPFGAIDEQLDVAKRQSAVQSAIDELSAASMSEADAAVEAAGGDPLVTREG